MESRTKPLLAAFLDSVRCRHAGFSFFNQAHIRDLHLFIDRFAHVVDREQRDRDAGERFHFHPGLRDGARGAGHFAPPSFIWKSISTWLSGKGMTKRNQAARFVWLLEFRRSARSQKHCPSRSDCARSASAVARLMLIFPVAMACADSAAWPKHRPSARRPSAPM